MCPAGWGAGVRDGSAAEGERLPEPVEGEDAEQREDEPTGQIKSKTIFLNIPEAIIPKKTLHDWLFEMADGS